ncbi:hypothetical protein RUND412_011066 [Rhizina undulata]
MSLESALEEERLEILKLLERPNRLAFTTNFQSQSTPSSPRQAYASIIPPVHRTRSPLRQHKPSVSSLIDAASNSPSFSASNSIDAAGSAYSSLNNPSSSYTTSNTNGSHHRRSETYNGPPKLLKDRDRPNNNSYGFTPNDAYNFTMLPSVTATHAPKRVSQPNVSKPNVSKSYYENTMTVPSARGSLARRSMSPATNAALRHADRSASPMSANGRLSSPPPTRHQITTNNGAVLDLDRAYAMLTDHHLSRSGGVLESLPERKPIKTSDGEHIRLGSGESLTKEGGVRLQKDYDYVFGADETGAADSSTEEDSTELESNASHSGGSEEEERRGRTRSASTDDVAGRRTRSESAEYDIRSMLGIEADPGGDFGRKKKGKKVGIDARKDMGSMTKTSMSLLAAAEEERKAVGKAVSGRYNVRSLLPQISITPSTSMLSLPGATSPTTNRRPGVHPTTNFDLPSHYVTPVSSDTEADMRDLKRAQRMEMLQTPIVSTPETQRAVRTIIRGEYDEVVKEAAEANRRCRKYLVATDLSGEAQHALEWTIGTVLRDGDTLLAIYAADQDTVEDGSKLVPGDDAAELSSQVAAVGTTGLTVTTNANNHPHLPGTSSPLATLGDGVVERSRERTKAEKERFDAAEAISAMVMKLLKKTRLQVKVVVEVIHCKSPKHLLTEIIDYVEPTLVILGSRGRSALKGVLLGSFSNYLVTKSSVPVMVARKKLKQTKKYAKTNVRLTNNLTSTRQLAYAKVD